MKLLKSLVILGLSSLIAVTTSQAAEKQVPQQTQKRDIALERFNQNVGIHLVSRGLQFSMCENSRLTLSLHWIQNNRLMLHLMYLYQKCLNKHSNYLLAERLKLVPSMVLKMLLFQMANVLL